MIPAAAAGCENIGRRCAGCVDSEDRGGRQPLPSVAAASRI